MSLDFSNPLDPGTESDHCILCGHVVPNHHPECEYFKFSDKAPAEETLEGLEARLRELENAPYPDFEAIMTVATRVEEFRRNMVGGDEAAEAFKKKATAPPQPAPPKPRPAATPPERPKDYLADKAPPPRVPIEPGPAESSPEHMVPEEEPLNLPELGEPKEDDTLKAGPPGDIAPEPPEEAPRPAEPPRAEPPAEPAPFPDAHDLAEEALAPEPMAAPQVQPSEIAAEDLAPTADATPPEPAPFPDAHDLAEEALTPEPMAAPQDQPSEIAAEDLATGVVEKAYSTLTGGGLQSFADVAKQVRAVRTGVDPSGRAVLQMFNTFKIEVVAGIRKALQEGGIEKAHGMKIVKDLLDGLDGEYEMAVGMDPDAIGFLRALLSKEFLS
jgi:hypothetical protein